MAAIGPAKDERPLVRRKRWPLRTKGRFAQKGKGDPAKEGASLPIEGEVRRPFAMAKCVHSPTDAPGAQRALQHVAARHKNELDRIAPAPASGVAEGKLR